MPSHLERHKRTCGFLKVILGASTFVVVWVVSLGERRMEVKTEDVTTIITVMGGCKWSCDELGMEKTLVGLGWVEKEIGTR